MLESDDGGRWVTINGSAVFIGGDGKPQYGGKGGKGGKAGGGKAGGDRSGKSQPDGKGGAKPSSTAPDDDIDGAVLNIGGSGSTDPVEVLAGYVDSNYLSINKNLRDGRIDETTKVEIETLDKAFDEYGETLDSDLTVFRGSKDDVFAGAPVGTELQDNAFVSTSEDAEIAAGFAKGKDYLYQITVPAGSRVIDIDKSGVSRRTAAEKEILLKRGVRFRVTGQNYQEFKVGDKMERRLIYELEVIQ